MPDDARPDEIEEERPEPLLYKHLYDPNSILRFNPYRARTPEANKKTRDPEEMSEADAAKVLQPNVAEAFAMLSGELQGDIEQIETNPPEVSASLSLGEIRGLRRAIRRVNAIVESARRSMNGDQDSH